MSKNRVEDFIKNPKKALYRLSFPIAIAMFVQILYNMVDTAFVGRLGSESIAAITFAFPIFFMIVGINAGMGVGINSVISRCLGKKNKCEAENAAMHGILYMYRLGHARDATHLQKVDSAFRALSADGWAHPGRC